jgi:hypothetical protein
MIKDSPVTDSIVKSTFPPPLPLKKKKKSKINCFNYAIHPLSTTLFISEPHVLAVTFTPAATLVIHKMCKRTSQ